MMEEHYGMPIDQIEEYVYWNITELDWGLPVGSEIIEEYGMTSTKQSGAFFIGDKKNDPNRKTIGPERILKQSKILSNMRKKWIRIILMIYFTPPLW